MSKLVVANWKANPQTGVETVKLAKASDKKNVVICPPFLFLEAVKKNLKKAMLGAQDVFWKEGAFTGEVSVKELKSLGVKYVIVGHSEQRRNFKETDAIINKKVKLVIGAGLKAILCVGEELPVRKKGITAAKKFVKSQLQKDLKNVKKINNLIVAYEPVWAISIVKNSKADTPEDAAKMIRFIKKTVWSRVLYGGSVSVKNIRGFLKYKEIDGFLIGGASLKAKDFQKMIKILR